MSIFMIEVCLLLVVGCDGILGSHLRFDKCGICGGIDSTCHIISGIFTQTVLPPGYNRVTSIPKGACNINITELSPSLNRLALKISNGSYVINGNWALGYSNDYEGAGTIFTYYHPSPTEVLEAVVEYIIAPGPINSTIDIMVIHEHMNRGIMYTYTIPSQKGHPSPNHPHHLRHHGRRHLTSASLASTTAGPTVPAQFDGTEVQSDQIDGGGSSQHDPAIQRSHQKPPLPRLYRPPAAGSYQYPHGSVPNSRFSSISNNSAPGSEPHTADSGFRPSIYRGPQVPAAANHSSSSQSAGDSKLDRNRLTEGGGSPSAWQPGRSPYPGINYRGPAHRPVQPRINYGIQGPPAGPPSSAGLGQPHYGISGQPGIGYGQPHSGIYPPAAYRQPVWYPGQQGGYQQPYAPYAPPSYPSYDQRPYPIHQPAPNVQQPYYPARNPSLEQPPRDASVYNPYDYYQGRLPSPLNDQRAVPPPSAGRPSTYNGAGDFAWKISGFTECSKTCGGGVQDTLIVCMKVTGVQVVVTDENCDPAVKPTGRTVTCNTMACPPGWEASDWSECSTTCDRGQQTRIVECKQRMSASYAVSVSATRCLHEPRPESSRVCNEDKPCVQWLIGDWSQCSTECGRGQRTREVLCINVENKPIAENKCNGTKPRSNEYCDMGSCAKTWFYTDWSEECSTGCGDGVQTRHIHCSAEPERCSEINRPKSEKPCKNDVPCGGKWFTGPWSDCAATCGEGVIKRDVVCMKKLGKMMAVVSDENCEVNEKPETEEPCELEPCTPEWYTTDWLECSRSCDTGLRLREAKCLDENQEPSQSCDPDEKPETRQTCNTQKCPSRVEQNDTQPLVISCQDKFKNCRVVVQARLCRYPYYKDVCCFSCISHDHEEET